MPRPIKFVTMRNYLESQNVPDIDFAMKSWETITTGIGHLWHGDTIPKTEDEIDKRIPTDNRYWCD